MMKQSIKSLELILPKTLPELFALSQLSWAWSFQKPILFLLLAVSLSKACALLLGSLVKLKEDEVMQLLKVKQKKPSQLINFPDFMQQMLRSSFPQTFQIARLMLQRESFKSIFRIDENKLHRLPDH